MNKIFDKATYIEIGLIILCVVFMFFPFFYLEAGSTAKNFNAWHAIAGVEADGYVVDQYFDFSPMCLIPYALLLIIVVINVIFDNKNNINADIAKIILFIITTTLFIFFLHLLKPADWFSSINEALRHVSKRPGNYLSAAATGLGSIVSIGELIYHLKLKKKD